MDSIISVKFGELNTCWLFKLLCKDLQTKIELQRFISKSLLRKFDTNIIIIYSTKPCIAKDYGTLNMTKKRFTIF